MTYPATPKDVNQLPVSSIYIPGSGWVAIQGTNSSTDGSGNASGGVVSALYGKNTQPGDTAVLVDSTGHLLVKAATNDIADLATIVPGVQGWIAATGTGTANQDDALTFAQQVRKVALYNASANNVPLEFDQTATATSFPIPPGAFWIIDNVLCTSIHVYPSVLLPINTTNGLYVKGWK